MRFLLLFVLFVISPSSQSTNCRKHTYGSVEKDVANAYGKYESIFVALVQETPGGTNEYDLAHGLEYEMTVLQSLKGAVNGQSHRVKVSVFDRMYRFAPGQEYLVFGKVEAGYAMVNECSPTGLLSNSLEKLGLLDEISTTR
ncbi:MAG: hypothetical protein AAF358_19775 [Pseudomonadota bacterium]